MEGKNIEKNKKYGAALSDKEIAKANGGAYVNLGKGKYSNIESFAFVDDDTGEIKGIEGIDDSKHTEGYRINEIFDYANEYGVNSEELTLDE